MFGLIIGLFLIHAQTTDPYVAARQASAADPKSEERLMALVAILYEHSRDAQALALLEPFVKGNRGAPRAKLFLALGYARQEKYAEARKLATEVVAVLPNDYYAHHILGLSLSGLNQFNIAASEFQKAVGIKPDFAESHFQLGLTFSRDPKTLQQSMAAYKRAVELGYSGPEIHRNLGLLNNKLGNFDEAVAELKRALELQPDYADAYFQLADVFRKSGDLQEAAVASRKFQDLNASLLDRKERQKKAQGLYQDGMKLIENDDMGAAYQVFKNAAQTLPELDAAYYRIAQLEYLGGNEQLAAESIRKAIQLNPFEAEYHFVLARCLEHSDPKAATAAITEAIALNANVGDFHNLLGNLFGAAGNYPSAVQSYRRAVALEPGNQAFKANLAAAQRRVPRDN